MKYFVIILLGLAVRLDAYLIVQMRKGNSSEAGVDTVIHNSEGTQGSLPPSGPVHRGARRRAYDASGDQIDSRVDRRSDLRLGLNTGSRRNPSESGVSQIIQMLSDAYDKYFKPQVQARSAKSNQGSPLAVELKSESILRSVEDFLASPGVKQAASELARKAAIVVRAIQKEM